MACYLIAYVSPERGACYSVERAKTPDEAKERHLATFPNSRAVTVRQLK